VKPRTHDENNTAAVPTCGRSRARFRWIIIIIIIIIIAVLTVVDRWHSFRQNRFIVGSCWPGSRRSSPRRSYRPAGDGRGDAERRAAVRASAGVNPQYDICEDKRRSKFCHFSMQNDKTIVIKVCLQKNVTPSTRLIDQSIVYWVLQH